MQDATELNRNRSANREGGEAFVYSVAVLIRHWKPITIVVLTTGALAAATSLILPPTYTAVTTFVSETDKELASFSAELGSLASQFGIRTSTSGNSPKFYADLLRSRSIRDQLLLSEFGVPREPASGDSATLVDLLGVEGRSGQARLEVGRKILERDVRISIDNVTGVVTVAVQSESPRLAADIANTLFGLLNSFNSQARRSSAHERRRFIEGRVNAAQEELRQAEEQVRTFQEANRIWEGSPELSFEFERLERQLRIKAQVLIGLRQQHEEARIQEVDDTPLLTVIDRAVAPHRRSKPRRKLIVISAMLAAALLSVTAAFAHDYVARVSPAR